MTEREAPTVVSISDKQKPCDFCGMLPPCPAWSCPKIKRVEVDGEGWSVEFWPIEIEVTLEE